MLIIFIPFADIITRESIQKLIDTVTNKRINRKTKTKSQPQTNTPLSSSSLYRMMRETKDKKKNKTTLKWKKSLPEDKKQIASSIGGERE